MKYFLSFITTFIVFNGCSESTPVENVPANSMKAVINGKNWSGLGKGLRTNRFGVESVSVDGSRLSDKSFFTFVLDGMTQPGEYKIEGESEFMMPRHITYMINANAYYAKSGIVKIEVINEQRAKGQFSFMAINPDAPNAPDTVLITDGEFDAALQRFP